MSKLEILVTEVVPVSGTYVLNDPKTFSSIEEATDWIRQHGNPQSSYKIIKSKKPKFQIFHRRSIDGCSYIKDNFPLTELSIFDSEDDANEWINTKGDPVKTYVIIPTKDY